jgi:hypothetical protein
MLLFPSWREFKNFAVDVGHISRNRLRTGISISSSLTHSVGGRRFHSSEEVEMVVCDSECKIQICTVGELINSCRCWTSASMYWGIVLTNTVAPCPTQGAKSRCATCDRKNRVTWMRTYMESPCHSTSTVLRRPIQPTAPLNRRIKLRASTFVVFGTFLSCHFEPRIVESVLDEELL